MSLGYFKITAGKYPMSFARTDHRIIPTKLEMMEYLINSKKKYVNERASFKI